MGRMVASTLKLGIAILNGGNSTVQQVLQCMAIDSIILHFTINNFFYIIYIYKRTPYTLQVVLLSLFQARVKLYLFTATEMKS